MNLMFFLFLGILSYVHGIYKIPKHDACVLRVLLCDDFTKPLTPVDNSTLEMFESLGQLNAICDELAKFRICLNNATSFCTEHSKLDVGFELLKNRQLAFDLCIHDSALQQVYAMVEKCVNQFSSSAINFCTDKAVETVGLNFSLLDYESECRFLGTIQHCHVAVITDKCGNVAGNMLEKLVVFRGERDFLCIDYEKDNLNDSEAFYTLMESYVQQYRNISDQIEKKNETERIDGLESTTTLHEDFVQDQTSSEFQSRISSPPEENCASANEPISHHERPLDPYSSHCLKKRPLCCGLVMQEIPGSNIPSNTAQQTDKISESYACQTKASFLLTEIRPNGELEHLGWGEADLLWTTYSPLKDLTCAWMVNTVSPMPLIKCSILIDHSVLVSKVCEGNTECDLPFGVTLSVYEAVNKREAKRVAELRAYSFYKHSSDDEGSDMVISFFQKYAQDIRYFCSDEHKEQVQAHSTSRIGLMPSEFYKDGLAHEQSDISDEKYNFYVPEQKEYSMDTEIHLLSSGNGNLESQSEAEDDSTSQNYDGNLNTFGEEMVNEKNINEPFDLHPTIPSKFSSHSYQPYELFRPRIGEILEPDDDISRHDLGIADVTESNTNQNLLLEDTFKNDCSTHLNAENFFPEMPEYVSNLEKLIGYCKESCMGMANQLDILNKLYEKIQVSEEKQAPFSSAIWKVEETKKNSAGEQIKNEEISVVTPSADIEMSMEQYITVHEDSYVKNMYEEYQAFGTKCDSQDSDEALDGQQIKNEETFVVSSSANIEMSNEPDRTVHENPGAHILDEYFQTLDTIDDSQDNAEVLQVINTKDSIREKDFSEKSTKARNSKVNFLELISNYQNNKPPFSYKLVKALTNYNVTSEEEGFLPKSEMFSRRSHQSYKLKKEEMLFNAFEILAKVKIDVRRIRKILKETRMEKSRKNSSLRKIEL